MSLDPIADLRLGCEHLQRQTGASAQLHIAMHERVYLAIIAWYRYRIERAERFLARPVLSGSFAKRQRQTARGVAGLRNAKRTELKRKLLHWRAHLAALDPVATSVSSSRTFTSAGRRAIAKLLGVPIGLIEVVRAEQSSAVQGEKLTTELGGAEDGWLSYKWPV